jgi:tRNA dimethylallyltransferase
MLAKKYNGEIISADSRQVYKKMTIATGKPQGTWQEVDGSAAYVVDGVPHYLMDLVDPGEEFTLAQFKESALSAIRHIFQRGKVPIVVGGTGLYLWSLIDNLSLPPVAPNKKLRVGLEGKSLPELVELLHNIDPKSAKKIDLKNPQRVIRALEVAILTGASFADQQQKAEPLFNVLQLGIRRSLTELHGRINERVAKQFADGIIEETKELLRQHYQWKLPSMKGIGYKEIDHYLQGELTLAEAREKIQGATRRYAKRQLTWFKRDERIRWVELSAIEETQKLVEDFLGSA